MEPELKTYCKYCQTEISSSSIYCCNSCSILDQHNYLSVQKLAHKSSNNNFIHLNSLSFKKTFELSPDSNTYLFHIQGLSCSSCVHLLEKVPEFLPDVLSAQLNFGESEFKVTLSEKGELAKVASLISDWGYIPTLIQNSAEKTQIQKIENRKFLSRIAVAGACSGNIMLFVIPIYAGLAGELETLFSWISFLLFIPVFFYSAIPFYKGAWNSIRYQVINIDLPVTIALLLCSGLSFYHLIRGNGKIYFDSTAMFVFLILSARYLQKRVQQSFLSEKNYNLIGSDAPIYRLKDIYRLSELTVAKIATELARLTENDYQNNSDNYHNNSENTLNFEAITFQDIKPEDVIRVNANQTLPIDGELLSKSVSFDTSLFDGESLPKQYINGMQVFAGMKCLDHDVFVKAKSDYLSSRMGSILKKVFEETTNKSKYVKLTDKLAQYLILFVLLVSAIFFYFYSKVNPIEAVERSLALIVLACPCALAFGAPLTYGLAIQKALKSGIVIKNADVLEKILFIKNIFFDKTGTVTTGKMQVVKTEPENLSSNIISILLGLENESEHPVAFAIREKFKNKAANPIPFEITDMQSIPGKGVAGVISGKRYSLTSVGITKSSSNQPIADLTKKNHTELDINSNIEESYENIIELRVTSTDSINNNTQNSTSEYADEYADNNNTEDFEAKSQLLCKIYLTDTIRPQIKNVIQGFQNNNINCFMLSGDKKICAQKVGREVGFHPDNIFFECSPEEKLQILKKYENTLMIGDGGNDALSLSNADVGVSIKGGMDLSLKSAPVYLAKSGTFQLPELFTLAKQANKVLIRNLVISLVYNIFGGAFALLGYINPLTAAILMPISSALIVASSVSGFNTLNIKEIFKNNNKLEATP